MASKKFLLTEEQYFANHLSKIGCQSDDENLYISIQDIPKLPVENMRLANGAIRKIITSENFARNRNMCTYCVSSRAVVYQHV